MEQVHPGTGPRTAQREVTPLAPLGQGVGGPPAPERQRPPSPGPSAPVRASWGAGPGGGGYAPQAGQLDLVSPSGLRFQQVAPYAGASQAAELKASPPDLNAPVRKTIRDLAGPYQKEAAIRAAENAIRPWSAYAGLGERRGAQFADLAAGSRMAEGLGYGRDAQAPSRFTLPDPAYAAAVSRTAQQVARAGTAQMGTAGSYSPVPGHRPRELWPANMDLPQRYCAGCRGDHDPENEMNPLWEPYTPTQRLACLGQLQSDFVKALLNRQLCVALNDDSRVNPVRWTWVVTDGDGDDVQAQPRNFSKQDFIRQLALMYDGLREGHEPYRHLATQAAQAFLDTGAPHLPAAAPELVRPLRLALQTYEPSLVGHAVLMLQRLLRSHPKVPARLVPHLKHLLPAMALMRRRHFAVHLPPPFCCSPAGSFTGQGVAPEAGRRRCQVCGCPLDRELASKRAKLLLEKKLKANPHLLNQEEDQQEAKEYERHPIKGRWSKKYVLEDLIGETLDLLVELAGRPALAEVVKCFPTFSYHNPKG